MEVLVTFRLAPEFGPLYSSLFQEDWPLHWMGTKWKQVSCGVHHGDEHHLRRLCRRSSHRVFHQLRHQHLRPQLVLQSQSVSYYVLLILMGLTMLIVAIISASLTCKPLCCRPVKQELVSTSLCYISVEMQHRVATPNRSN